MSGSRMRGVGISVIATLALGAIAACGKSGDSARAIPPQAAAPSAAAPSAAAPSAAAPSSQPAPTPQAAAPPPPALTPPAPTPPAAASSAGPLATGDGDYPGISVAIQSLTRGPNAVTLRFVLINNSKSAFNLGANFGESSVGGEYRSIGGTNLLDAANKRKYFTQRDADGTCLCSRAVPDIDPQSQATLWAKFPAPPPDVRAMTVVIPHFVPMENIPIGQ